jgi:hypothetical protein
MQLVELGLVIFCSGHQFETSGTVTTGTHEYFSRPSSVVHHPPNWRFSEFERVGGVLGSSNAAGRAWIGNFLFMPPIWDIGHGDHRNIGLSHAFLADPLQ